MNAVYKFKLYTDDEDIMNPYIIKNGIRIGSIIPLFLLPQGEICYDINDYNKL